MKYFMDDSNNDPQEYDEPDYFDGKLSARKVGNTSARILTDRPISRSMDSTRPYMVPALNLSASASILSSSQTPLPLPSPTPSEGDYNCNSTVEYPGIAMSDTSSSPLGASIMPTATADLKSVLDAIGTRHLKMQKDEWRQQAKERVFQQAFERCLDDVEQQAVVDEHQRFAAKKQFDDWRSSMRQKTIKSKEMMVDLKKTLDAQVGDIQDRHLQQKLELKNSLCASILPETAGGIGEDGKKINTRLRISKELERQIQQNEESKLQAKHETLMKERDFLDKVQLEDEFSKAMARSTHLEKQKDLLEAWERDCHVRNVKKLQSHGSSLVKDYVQRNLADPISTISTGTLGKSITMSIGYDPRTGKI
jgi:hypothetical protein